MALSESALISLREFAGAGNYTGYYQTLIINGVGYGYMGLAASTDGYSGSPLADLAGKFANNYLENKYFEVTGYELTNSQRDSIRRGLILADLEYREVGDVTGVDIRDYHHAVFESLNIPPEAWTGTIFEKWLGTASWCWESFGCGPEELHGQNGLDALNRFISSIDQAVPDYLEFIEDLIVDGVLVETYLENLRNEIVISILDLSKISSNTSIQFISALLFFPRIDPLALDLDGDGIETISANSGITFDFDGDGLKTGTGWVKGDDGFLVLDRNGNGAIDTGKELFGVDTLKSNGQLATDGFDALRDLDGNADGVFNAADAQFANVRVWQDLNQDGVAQAGELKSLAEHNITAINLASTQTVENSNGNLISAVGSFTRGDGTVGTVGTVNGNQSLVANLDLASNPFYREFTDSLPLDEAAQALPDMQGSGAVRDLRQASMLNAELKTLLTAYSLAQTRAEQMALLWIKGTDLFLEKRNSGDRCSFPAN